jgi:thioredoxin reductase (NADPH)
MEAALRCWRVGAQVALSYRGAELNEERIKPHLWIDMNDRLKKDEIRFFPSTIPVDITPSFVKLAGIHDKAVKNSDTLKFDVDAVLLCIGFEADMTLFKKAGVTLIGDDQVPKFNELTMETNIPGLYVAGTVAGGTQNRFTYFISTSHDHVAKIVKAITGHTPGPLGSVPARNNAVTWEEVKAN